jgi:hypothetical protein
MKTAHWGAGKVADRVLHRLTGRDGPEVRSAFRDLGERTLWARAPLHLRTGRWRIAQRRRQRGHRGLDDQRRVDRPRPGRSSARVARAPPPCSAVC